MLYLDLTLSALLFLSLLSNFYFLFKSKAEKKQPEMGYDARALLRDLASGPALVKIEYVDRADVLLRSPRHFS